MNDREDSFHDILDGVGEDDPISIKEHGGITRQHWQEKTSGGACANRDCGKAFKRFLESGHHCRRCGRLFCKKCLAYKRRLNALAKPGPNGRLYKVCKGCYDQGPQSLGSTRSWTKVFRYAKQESIDSTGYPSSPDAGTCPSLREKLDLKQECDRLVAGFKANVGNSDVRRAMVDVTSVFAVPEWQKSSLVAYGAMASKCEGCSREFGVLRKKHTCRVCGTAVCSSKKCSSKDLLLYFPDKHCGAPTHAGSGDAANEVAEQKRGRASDGGGASGPSEREAAPEGAGEASADESLSPEIAIIKIVGSPVKEPNVCLYLRVCRQCQEALEDRQVDRYRRGVESTRHDPAAESWTDMLQQCDHFREIEAKIESQLSVYQHLVDYIEDGREPKRTQHQETSKPRSNTQTLAKAQSDLSDHLTQFTMMIFALKQIKPVTHGQTFIYKNILKSKCQFYQENMYIFRESKKRLEESTPSEVLQSIQTIVDQNAVNSCYVTVKQLALELLHLCTKHQLGEQLPQRLVVTETIMCEDLKQEICRNPAENWQVHEACLNELLQSQLKNKRLIKPSRRFLRRFGNEHVRDVIHERCVYVIRQVHSQLEEKTTAKHFNASKTELKKLLAELKSNKFSDEK